MRIYHLVGAAVMLAATLTAHVAKGDAIDDFRKTQADGHRLATISVIIDRTVRANNAGLPREVSNCIALEMIRQAIFKGDSYFSSLQDADRFLDETADKATDFCFEDYGP